MRVRSVDRGVTHGAILISNRTLVMERRDVGRRLFRNAAMAFKAKLSYRTSLQHFRVRGTMRRVARRTSFNLKRCVFVNEWTLFVGMALNACGVATYGQPGLLCFKAAVSVVAIAAVHRPLKYLVMERFHELGFGFVMTRHTQLRLALS